MRTKYLPPGSMKAQRRHGRIEGSAATLFLVGLIGLLLIALTPREIYESSHATTQAKKNEPMRFDRAPIPPCNDMEAKDCMSTNNRHLVHTVPEPSTLWLAAVGSVAASYRKIMNVVAAAWISYGKWRGMDVEDE